MAAVRQDPRYCLNREDSFFVRDSSYGSYIAEDRTVATIIATIVLTMIAVVVSAKAQLFESAIAYVGFAAVVSLAIPVFLEVFWGFGRAFSRKDAAMSEALDRISMISSETSVIRAFEARCEVLLESVGPDSESAFSTYLRGLRDRRDTADETTRDDLAAVIEVCESTQSDIRRDCLLISEKLTRARALIEERKAYTEGDAHLFADVTLSKDDINASLYALLTEIRDELGRLQRSRSQTLTGAEGELD